MSNRPLADRTIFEMRERLARLAVEDKRFLRDLLRTRKSRARRAKKAAAA